LDDHGDSIQTESVPERVSAAREGGRGSAGQRAGPTDRQARPRDGGRRPAGSPGRNGQAGAGAGRVATVVPSVLESAAAQGSERHSARGPPGGTRAGPVRFWDSSAVVPLCVAEPHS